MDARGVATVLHGYGKLARLCVVSSGQLPHARLSAAAARTAAGMNAHDVAQA
eukprot:gene2158-9812_t